MNAEEKYRKFNELLVRQLEGRLDAAEEERFRELLRSDSSLEKELEAYRKLWEASGGLEATGSYDLDAEWTRMQDIMPADFHAHAVKGGRSLSLLQFAYRIAAILLIGLFLGLGGFYVVRLSTSTLVVAENQRLEHILPDGSHIWLNHDSKIRYKTAFDGSSRHVSLKGEAFFDVTGDSLRPFVIEAGDARVEVLGTSFNVRAYQEDPLVKITVESGVVALSARKTGVEQIVLKAGNSGSYDVRNKELVLKPRSDPNNFSWKSGKLYFEKSSLTEVARILEHTYKVQIEIPDEALARSTITVSFSDQSLESILEVLAATLDLEVRRDAGKIEFLWGEEPGK